MARPLPTTFQATPAYAALMQDVWAAGQEARDRRAKRFRDAQQAAHRQRREVELADFLEG